MSTAHIAYVQLMHVDPVSGVVIDPLDPATTLSMMAKTNTEFRVIHDTSIPNTANNPTIKTYIELETSAGFLFKHMDQTFIITQN